MEGRFFMNLTRVFNLRRILLALPAVFVILLVPTLQACSNDQRVGSAGAGNSSKQVALQWRGEAENFRLIASVDLLHAIRKYGASNANLRMSTLGQEMASSADWRTTWELFLSVSLPNIARANSESALIGYYHPWSDLMLLTKWRKVSSDKSQIESVDIVPGSVVRGEVQTDIVGRNWQRGDLFAPEAVGVMTARTVRAFENRFSDSGKDPLAKSDEQEKTVLGSLSRLAFADFRSEVVRLYGKQGGQPAVMWLWQGLRDEAKSGQSARQGPIGDSIRAIGKLDPKIQASFVPVSYLTTDKAELLMLASTIQPNLYVAVQTGRSEGKEDLRRADLLSFQSFYTDAGKGEAK